MTTFHKIKDYLEKHPKQYELLRYVVAGPSTVLSMVISYGMEFLLAARPELDGGLFTVGDRLHQRCHRPAGDDRQRRQLGDRRSLRLLDQPEDGVSGEGRHRRFRAAGAGRVWRAGRCFALFEEGMASSSKLIGVSNV